MTTNSTERTPPREIDTLRRELILGTAAALATATFLPRMSFAQEIPAGFNTPIPDVIMTPDLVETRLGTLRFHDGRPDAETVRLVYDNLDFMRGVETFLNFIPAASIEGIRRGFAEIGVTEAHHVALFEQLMDSNALFLTGNTDTVYAMSLFDLERDGPVVIEVPPGTGPGTVDDAFFRFIIDMGAPGPDQGRGGKYLILPPDYVGELDPPHAGYEAYLEGQKYFVARSPSYINLMVLRGFLKDGSPVAAATAFREGLKVYPLSSAASAPPMEFTNLSTMNFNTIHANTYEFYEELDHVIQHEPLGFIEPELRGIAGSIGIQKGRPFAPDERMEAILQDAIKVGNATARAIFLRPRDPAAFLYENSTWYTGFIGEDYRWLRDDGMGGRNADARTLFFYSATVNTPAMAARRYGFGSQYALNSTDSTGEFLDGAKNYRLNIPANMPAKDFWAVVAYDPQTRSQLQTGQPFPSRNNIGAALAENADGSVDLWFGPTAPEGKESNWIQTVPGKGWFVLLRLYGPLEPWFDRSWRPGEFELLG